MQDGGVPAHARTHLFKGLRTRRVAPRVYVEVAPRRKCFGVEGAWGSRGLWIVYDDGHDLRARHRMATKISPEITKPNACVEGGGPLSKSRALCIRLCHGCVDAVQWWRDSVKRLGVWTRRRVWEEAHGDTTVVT